jgi:hypothetical protein
MSKNKNASFARAGIVNTSDIKARPNCLDILAQGKTNTSKKQMFSLMGFLHGENMTVSAGGDFI